MLDIIIAYVVILLVLSTITTAILQLFQRIVYLRHWWLVRCLGRLRVRVAGGSLPAARESARRLLAHPEANPMGLARPDYIEGSTARRWLEDALVRRGIRALRNEEPDADDQTLEAEAEAWAKTRMPWIDADDEDHWKDWWEGAEKQMSSTFRLYVVVFSSVIVGGLLSVATGLEAVSVARHLTESPAEVQALIDDSKRRGGDTGRHADDDTYLRLVDRELRLKLPEDDQDDLRTKRLQLLVCYDVASQAAEAKSDLLRAAAFEVWLTADPPPEPPEGCPLDTDTLKTDLLPAVRNAHDTIEDGLGFGGYPISPWGFERIIGHLLMALFIGLGAPFWFELLGVLRLPLKNKPPSPSEFDPAGKRSA